MGSGCWRTLAHRWPHHVGLHEVTQDSPCVSDSSDLSETQGETLRRGRARHGRSRHPREKRPRTPQRPHTLSEMRTSTCGRPDEDPQRYTDRHGGGSFCLPSRSWTGQAGHHTAGRDRPPVGAEETVARPAPVVLHLSRRRCRGRGSPSRLPTFPQSSLRLYRRHILRQVRGYGDLGPCGVFASPSLYINRICASWGSRVTI